LPILLIDVDELEKREDLPFVKNIKSSGLLVPGNILIQNPHDPDIYFRESEAPVQISKSKIMYYQTFFSLLGVKSFQFKELANISDSISVEYGLQAGAEYKQIGASGEVEIKNKIENLFRNELSIGIQYSGGSPNIEEAEEWLREKRLYNDIILRNLLEIFKKGKNPIEKFEIKIRLLKELNNIFSILSGLNLSVLPVFSAKLKAGFNILTVSKSDYIVTFEVLWK